VFFLFVGVELFFLDCLMQFLYTTIICTLKVIFLYLC
jgi:hypothetical protein